MSTRSFSKENTKIKKQIITTKGPKMATKTTTKAKETKCQRKERISNSNNGATMRTRVVKDKKKYTRKTKHKKMSKEEIDAKFVELETLMEFLLS